VTGPPDPSGPGQVPQLSQGLGDRVVAPDGARHDDQQIAAGRGGDDRVGQPGLITGLSRQAARVAAGFAGLARQHQHAGLEITAGSGRMPHLIPGGQHRDYWSATYQQLRGSRGRSRS
jgi:hypothetical protein